MNYIDLIDLLGENLTDEELLNALCDGELLASLCITDQEAVENAYNLIKEKHS